MAVRANKPAFNIREKLKELTSKFGLKGTELARAETAQDARDLVSAGRKNIIINGDMRIAQRGTSTQVVANTAYYTCDRFAFFQGLSLTDATVTGTQQTVTDLPGHTKSFRVTNVGNSAITSTSDGWIKYNAEDKDFDQVNWLNGSNKSVTLSFWAKSNRTGQFSVTLNAGTFSAAKNIKTYTLDSADTWKKIEVTYQDPSTWGNSGSTGARIYWPMATGSTYYNTTPDAGWIYSSNHFGTVGDTQIHGDDGAYFEITGVQLEVGKNATDFEYRSYGEELALCQRYYYRHATGTTGAGGAQPICNALYYSAANAFGVVTFPTTMRDIPELDQNSAVTGFQILRAGGNEDIVTFNVQERSNAAFTIECSGLSGTIGHAAWFRTTSDSVASVPYLGFSAEI